MKLHEYLEDHGILMAGMLLVFCCSVYCSFS